jgi:hypothetical protein
MKYAKTLVAVVIAAVTAVQVAVTDDVITAQEWVTVALAALGALGVYAIPNRAPEGAGEQRSASR